MAGMQHFMVFPSLWSDMALEFTESSSLQEERTELCASRLMLRHPMEPCIAAKEGGNTTVGTALPNKQGQQPVFRAEKTAQLIF